MNTISRLADTRSDVTGGGDGTIEFEPATKLSPVTKGNTGGVAKTWGCGPHNMAKQAQTSTDGGQVTG
jgi:hypothetical protein